MLSPHANKGLQSPRGSEIPRTDLLKQLGFYGPRLAEKQKLYYDYLRLVGLESGLDATLSADQFVAYMSQEGFDPQWARSAFRALDLDHSGRMNRHEFILGIAALNHELEDPSTISSSSLKENDASTTTSCKSGKRDRASLAGGKLQGPASLAQLRLNVVFHFYDSNDDGVLDQSEVTEMVREMCTGPTHIAALTEQLGLTPGTAVSFKDFQLGIETGGFRDLQLYTRDLLRNPTRQPKSCIIDSRTVLADPIHHKAHGPPPNASPSAPHPKGSVNPELVLAPELDASQDYSWKGPLWNDSPATAIAQSIVGRMTELVTTLPDDDDAGWFPDPGDALKFLLETTDARSQMNLIETVARDCKRIVTAQPTLVRAKAPCKIFGDVHGQLYDLLLLFREFGFPSHRSGGDVQAVSYVFNGDWVDRGPHQLECVLVLFALKVCYPSRIWLVRGNHEFRDMNRMMQSQGFHAACASLFPPSRLPHCASTIFEVMHETFDWLPIAALVGDPKSECILVLHGGIGDGTWGIEALANDVPRPLRNYYDETRPHLMHALWSDPSNTDAHAAYGVHDNPERGVDIPKFGPDVTEDFCTKNQICLVVRSHQLAKYGYTIAHSGRLITVFSARNYCGKNTSSNDGAILLAAMDEGDNLRVYPKRLLHRD